MPEAISNTLPLLYLCRIEALDWLPELCTQKGAPMAVVHELQEGRRKGYDVPNPADHAWLHLMEPRSMPSEWLILDLGAGELAALALALENPTRVVLLDDGLARILFKQQAARRSFAREGQARRRGSPRPSRRPSP